MGFYLRKSQRLGPFRLNLSKSGLGVSFGVKGMRVGTGPRGAMVHMGRHGLYYRRSLKGLASASAASVHGASAPTGAGSGHAGSDHTGEIDGITEIDSSKTLAISDDEVRDTLELIRSTRARPRLVIIGLVPLLGALALPVALPLFLAATVLATPALAWLDSRRRTVYLLYEIDPDCENELQPAYDKLEELLSATKIWNVKGRRRHSRTKRSGGAEQSYIVEEVRPRWGSPNGISTNVRIPALPVGRQTLHFLPDMLLIEEGKFYGAVAYSHLTVSEACVEYVEHGPIPADAEHIRDTWQYVNKDGSPDRRFKNNAQLPVLRYLQIHLQSDTGLDELVQVSDARLEGVFSEALALLRA